MRTVLRFILPLTILVFYLGVAGTAAAPYAASLRSFVQNATTSLPIPLSKRTPTGTPPPSPRKRLSPALMRAVQHFKNSPTSIARRVNLLLLGSDNDQKFSSYGNPLTQVMIVLSIDPVSRTITLLSIPRDFWIHIPGYGYNIGPDGTVGWSKIDVAAEFGFDSAACTVETNFGIPIDHYVWIGLNGFVKMIDTLKGITLNVPHPVIDDTYPDDFGNNPYAYRRIYLPPGPQHLYGDSALHFVRSRHGDVQGDFGRSSRQQILLSQVRRTLLNQDPEALIALLPTLLSDFHDRLRTDLPADVPTALQYLTLLRSASHYTMRQVVLSPPYSTAGYSVQDHDPLVDRSTGQFPTVESAVFPNWPLINAKVQQLFGGQFSSQAHCSSQTTSPGLGARGTTPAPLGITGAAAGSPRAGQ